MEVHSERSSYIKKLNLLLRKTSPWGWSYTEPCCPYRVWGLHPWRCSELNWTQPWAACSDCAVSFEQMTWPNNLQRPLSTQTILWSHWIEDSAIWNQCWMSHNWDSSILTASDCFWRRGMEERLESRQRGRFQSLFLSKASSLGEGVWGQTSLVLFIQAYFCPTVGFSIGPTSHWCANALNTSCCILPW